MKFLDLDGQYKSIRKEIDGAIKNVFNGGFFIGGEEVEKFEEEFAKFCGVKYSISLNSGTDALFLSLKALGIGEGDEVITTPFTFIATAGSIINCGAKPVFVDIDPDSFNIDVSKIEKAITKKTKAIMPVHLFGQIADMAEIMKIAKKYKLFVIEDAAQAVGAEYKGKKAGTIGDFGCFSFFPSKNLGAYGDGGMIITNNKRLAEEVRLLKSHGSSSKDKYLNLVVGTNSRLDSLQAAILRIKLRHLDKWNKERAKKSNYYTKKLKGISGIVTPDIKEDRNHVFHQYALRVDSRDKIKKELEKAGIPVMIYYPLPLHMQPALKKLGHKKGDFPEAEKVSSEVLSLPIYPEIKKKDQDLIINSLAKIFK